MKYRLCKASWHAHVMLAAVIKLVDSYHRDLLLQLLYTVNY